MAAVAALQWWIFIWNIFIEVPLPITLFPSAQPYCRAGSWTFFQECCSMITISCRPFQSNFLSTTFEIPVQNPYSCILRRFNTLTGSPGGPGIYLSALTENALCIPSHDVQFPTTDFTKFFRFAPNDPRKFLRSFQSLHQLFFRIFLWFP